VRRAIEGKPYGEMGNDEASISRLLRTGNKNSISELLKNLNSVIRVEK